MALNKIVVALFMRLILGLIFFMQGFGKVFKWGVFNMYNSDSFKGAYSGLLPDFIIYVTAYYTSYIELIAGFLLLIGYKRNFALYGLGSVLVIVTFGHGLVAPIWDLSHVMYRTILLIALLIMPQEWDTISLDQFLKK